MPAMLRATYVSLSLLLCCVGVCATATATADAVTVLLDPQQSLSGLIFDDPVESRSPIRRPATPSEHEDDDLVAWAARIAFSDRDTATEYSASIETFLTVGVKTNVVHNFRARQAIRQTWAQRHLLEPLGVRVMFLGCKPDLSSYTNASERIELQRAIAIEKRIFNDLLTSELHCVDSYFTLVQKVVGYMHWLTQNERPQLKNPLSYVVVADDDVYVRVDQLVSLLLEPKTPTTRLYAGCVWANAAPKRDPSHKNYVSERDFPMAKFPWYAAGPFYVLSMDLVRFVARNRQYLKGLGANDDISVAVWLLALNVRPKHMEEVVVLRIAPCRDDALAVADLLPSAIRYLHENEVHNRVFCDGFASSQAMRQHRSILLHHESDDSLSAGESDTDTKLTWKLQHHAESNTLNIHVTITAGTSAIEYSYIPAIVRYEDALCARGATLLQAKLYMHVDDAFCQFHRRRLRAFLNETVVEDPNMQALLTLAHHNLQCQQRDDTKVVVLSHGGRHSRVLVECLFVEMYPNATILVVNDLQPDQKADVVVFSVLDSLGRELSSVSAEFIRDFGPDTQLIMISGETWDLHGLDPRVVLLSTVVSVQHAKALYIPVASSVFAESIQHSPLELLQSFTGPEETAETRGFCAYLYARCDRIRREFMFDLLNAIEPVDALGACQGTGQKPRPERRRARYENPFYTDEAIALYRNYRFVIAFENTFGAVGYVTEKIVTAFLAGAVPVYYGHTASVKTLFNPRAFINCGDFESLPACAQYVRQVHRSPEMYDAMRNESPVVDKTAFFEAFSWHPHVMQWSFEHLSHTTGIPTSSRLRRLLENESEQQ